MNWLGVCSRGCSRALLPIPHPTTYKQYECIKFYVLFNLSIKFFESFGCIICPFAAHINEIPMNGLAERARALNHISDSFSTRFSLPFAWLFLLLSLVPAPQHQLAQLTSSVAAAFLTHLIVCLAHIVNNATTTTTTIQLTRSERRNKNVERKR